MRNSRETVILGIDGLLPFSDVWALGSTDVNLFLRFNFSSIDASVNMSYDTVLHPPQSIEWTSIMSVTVTRHYQLGKNFASTLRLCTLVVIMACLILVEAHLGNNTDIHQPHIHQPFTWLSSFWRCPLSTVRRQLDGCLGVGQIS